MKRPGLIEILFLILITAASLSAIRWRPPVPHKIAFSGYAQGTTWNLAYYAEDTLVSKAEIDSTLLVIDSSLSIYKSYSQISRFNQSKTGIVIDEHMQNVVASSLDTYRQTGGVFDITVLPLTEAWGFGAKGRKAMPDSARVRSLLDCVSSDYLQLKGKELIKLKPCVSIDVNGIAQGYSVDVIARFIENAGIANYIIELGGELRARGKKLPENTCFKVGIESPSGDETGYFPIQKIVSLDSGAITTSGNYRNFHESNGKRISHLMDPRTGYPVQNELISVTVYAVDAMTADAYDNALMAMGLKDAMEFVEYRKDIAAYFIYHLPGGKVGDTASRRFHKLLQY